MLIHRHTGGLETGDLVLDAKQIIHRHTGGLEILLYRFDNL